MIRFGQSCNLARTRIAISSAAIAMISTVIEYITCSLSQPGLFKNIPAIAPAAMKYEIQVDPKSPPAKSISEPERLAQNLKTSHPQPKTMATRTRSVKSFRVIIDLPVLVWDEHVCMGLRPCIRCGGYSPNSFAMALPMAQPTAQAAPAAAPTAPPIAAPSTVPVAIAPASAPAPVPCSIASIPPPTAEISQD